MLSKIFLQNLKIYMKGCNTQNLISFLKKSKAGGRFGHKVLDNN